MDKDSIEDSTLVRAARRVLEPAFRFFLEYPLILAVLLGAAGYWGWQQSKALDDICHNLFAATDDNARGAAYEFTLDFEATADLFERMPTLRNATSRCHEMRDYMVYYDVLGSK